MFWRKPLALLGLLATVSSTVAAPTEVNLEWESKEGMFFRADRRSPDVIKADGGFKTFAQSRNTKPNYSLWDHCKIKEASASFGNLPDDGYVGTSTDVNFCSKWMLEKLEDGNTENIQSTIYKVASDLNLISCQETLLGGKNLLHTFPKYRADLTQKIQKRTNKNTLPSTAFLGSKS